MSSGLSAGFVRCYKFILDLSGFGFRSMLKLQSLRTTSEAVLRLLVQDKIISILGNLHM